MADMCLVIITRQNRGRQGKGWRPGEPNFEEALRRSDFNPETGKWETQATKRGDSEEGRIYITGMADALHASLSNEIPRGLDEVDAQNDRSVLQRTIRIKLDGQNRLPADALEELSQERQITMDIDALVGHIECNALRGPGNVKVEFFSSATDFHAWLDEPIETRGLNGNGNGQRGG